MGPHLSATKEKDKKINQAFNILLTLYHFIHFILFDTILFVGHSYNFLVKGSYIACFKTHKKATMLEAKSNML